MKTCPNCQAQAEDEAPSCPSCGEDFAQGEAPRPEALPSTPNTHPPDQPQPVPVPEDLPIPPPATPGSWAVKWAFLLAVLFLAGLGGVMLLGRFSAGKGMEDSGESAPSATDALGTGGEWDRVVALEGEPLGLAWNGIEFLMGNRREPWGFLRIQENGIQSKLPVVEEAQGGQAQLLAVTWNGKAYVGYADGAWFQNPGKRLFTVHDPTTLKVLSTHPAPDLLGALAWDGTSYWAATRRNTRDSGEEAHLYRFDEQFNETGRWDPPAYGCQGLAWVGPVLFWVDVFQDDMILMKWEGGGFQHLHRYATGINYPSGVAYDGQHLWVCDYGASRLSRVPPRLVRAFLSGDYRVRDHHSVEVARRLDAFAQGDTAALEGYLEMMRARTIPPEGVHEMVEALVSLQVANLLQPAVDRVLADPDLSAYHDLLRSEMARVGGTTPPGQETPAESPAVETPPAQASAVQGVLTETPTPIASPPTPTATPTMTVGSSNFLQPTPTPPSVQTGFGRQEPLTPTPSPTPVVSPLPQTTPTP